MLHVVPDQPIHVSQGWPAWLDHAPTLLPCGLRYLELPDDAGFEEHEAAWSALRYSGIVAVARPRRRYLAYLDGACRATAPGLAAACEPVALPTPASRLLMRTMWAMQRVVTAVGWLAGHLETRALARQIRKASR